jgi:HSP20 family protein
MADLMPGRNGPERRHLAEWRGHPMTRFRHAMDDLFDRFFGRPATTAFDNDAWTQPWGLDVSARGNELVARAELPGFEPDDLDVRVHGDLLTVRAERKHEEEGGRSYGRFEETIRIPAGADPDKVQADYRNGVLEVRMPLPEAAQGKRVPVRGAAANEMAAPEKAAAKT